MIVYSKASWNCLYSFCLSSHLAYFFKGKEVYFFFLFILLIFYVLYYFSFRNICTLEFLLLLLSKWLVFLIIWKFQKIKFFFILKRKRNFNDFLVSLKILLILLIFELYKLLESSEFVLLVIFALFLSGLLLRINFSNTWILHKFIAYDYFDAIIQSIVSIFTPIKQLF